MYSREEFLNVDRDPDLLCEILQQVDDRDGRVSLEEIRDAHEAAAVCIDRHLKFLFTEGYVRQSGEESNAFNVPYVVEQSVYTKNGNMRYCS